MKISTSLLLLFLCLPTFAQEGSGQVDDEAYTVKWKNGLRFGAPDGSVKLKIGGRMMNDWGFFSSDDSLKAAVNSVDNGVEFRRARLFVSGKLHEHYEFKAQFDFADDPGPEFKDVYMGLVDLAGFPDLRVGHFKEPFGLDELTSSKYGTFMERSLVAEFAPSRNTGIMLHGGSQSELVSWAAGFFRSTDDFGSDAGDTASSLTARVTGLPIYADDGAQLLHIGAAVSRSYPDSTVSFGSRPEAHLAPDYLDTGDITADGLTLAGLEAAYVSGPFSVQAEFAKALVDAVGMSDPSFSTYAVQTSFFLTGEHREYDRGTAEFDRVSPVRPFSAAAGGGAWEVALRLSNMDLDDAGVAGGKLNNVTLGLNWYLESNVRVMLNYVHADLDGVGESDSLGIRFQLDF